MTPTQMPLRITFRHLTPTESLEEAIRQRTQWLGTFHPDVLDCRVVVEVPHRHRRRGRAVNVRIEVSLPGGVVVVDHMPGSDASAEQVVHDAFDMARRRVEDAARLRRGDVKTAAGTGATA